MPFPLVIPNAAQVYLHWINTGKPFTNVLGAQKPAGVAITQALANSLGAAIKASLTSSGLVTHLGGAVGLETVGVRDISQEGMPEYIDAGPTITGGSVGEPLPGQIALVVSVGTERSGAKYRGRVYVGGFTETDNDASGQATQAAATAAQSFIQAVSDAMDNQGLIFAVLSRPVQAKTIPAVTIAARSGFATPALSLQVNNLLWDTQRRRATPGGGSTTTASGRRRRVYLNR
jgi:hypothetical protein